MICTKKKGCILIGNKKYFDGDILPKGFEVPKLWIDKGFVSKKMVPEVDLDAKAKADADAKAKAEKDKKK